MHFARLLVEVFQMGLVDQVGSRVVPKKSPEGLYKVKKWVTFDPMQLQKLALPALAAALGMAVVVLAVRAKRG